MWGGVRESLEFNPGEQLRVPAYIGPVIGSGNRGGQHNFQGKSLWGGGIWVMTQITQVNHEKIKRGSKNQGPEAGQVYYMSRNNKNRSVWLEQRKQRGEQYETGSFTQPLSYKRVDLNAVFISGLWNSLPFPSQKPSLLIHCIYLLCILSQADLCNQHLNMLMTLIS